MNKLLVLSVILLISINGHAKWVNGYIKLNNGETVSGRVNVPYVNMFSRAIIVKGIDLSHFYYSVRFSDEKKVKKYYYPGDIKAFGFTTNGMSYHFVSHDMHYNSIVKSERQREQFFNVLYSGKLTLLCHLVPLYYHTPGTYNWTGINMVNSYDYYLYAENKGLTKVEITKPFETLRDILVLYDVDKQFLDTLPDNLDRFDVYDVLRGYDKWLNAQVKSPVLDI